MRLPRIQRCQFFMVLGLAVAALAANSSSAADETPAAAKNRPRSNRLRKETSPYLLMHAQNPVDWYPWGPEAFEKAKAEGKLVFLSIGYSSCYWCHVMERKVFTNEAIAKILNQDFICIKVDREERPDVDEIYMTALQVYYQAIGAPSNGGWPLSIFLTPDGKPVAGGTYFPPEDTDGAQGFPTILARLTDLWKNNHDQMLTNAEILTTETKRVMRPSVSQETVEADDALVGFIFDSVAASFDLEFGGVDFHADHPNGPKFPTPVKLAFLQEQLQRNPVEEVSTLLDLTLMQLACGGIRDHIGGGFHRYSVDRNWDVPHFEKMLYDQAQMADLFTSAYRISEQPLFKQVAEELLDFVERELTSPEGGFYSALDAETNGIEGEYYVWDATELDRILGSDAKKFKDAYRVKDLSDFEHGNVLRLNPKKLPKAGSKEAVAAAKTLPGSERDEFTNSKQKLLEVRNLRKKPLRDDKILTAWNGLMIGAYARASTALKHPEYARTAERAASFMLTKLRDPQGKLLHSSTKGQARLNAYLDDYAYLINGLLALHEATEDPKWLKSARELQDDQLRMFLDNENGGFFFTSHQHEALLARPKNCLDGVQPAANSVSVRNLIKLSKQEGRASDIDEARAILELFAPQVEHAPRGYASFALATAELLESDSKKQTEKDDQAQENVAPIQIVQASKVDEKATDKEPLILLADQKEEKPKKDDVVTGRAYLSTDKLPAGGSCQFIVLLDVKEGWHIQSNPPKPENFKATKVSFKSKLGVELTDTKYPKGQASVIKFDGSNEVLDTLIYEGEVAIRGVLTVPEKAGGQTDDMEISIIYQACKDEACLAPKTIKLTGKLGVAKRGESVKSINSRLFPPAEAPKK